MVCSADVGPRDHFYLRVEAHSDWGDRPGRADYRTDHAHRRVCACILDHGCADMASENENGIVSANAKSTASMAFFGLVIDCLVVEGIWLQQMYYLFNSEPGSMISPSDGVDGDFDL